MALDATPGGENANSYATEAEADDYLLSRRFHADAWAAVSSPDKERLLIWATQLLDTHFDFVGTPNTVEQALRWPRSGVVDADDITVDNLTIPQLVKDATAELAFTMQQRDRITQPDLLGTGIDFAKVGPISVKVAGEAGGVPAEIETIPSHVAAMLAVFGAPKASTKKGDKQVRVERT